MIDFSAAKIVRDFIADYDLIITAGAYAKGFESDICLHPFLDSPTKSYIRYEAGAEEGVAAIFLHDFYCQNDGEDDGAAAKDAAAKNAVESFIESLDYGYLTSECNLSEEEMCQIAALVAAKSRPLLLVGSDFFESPRAKNIIAMLSHLAKNSRLKVAFLSPDSALVSESFEKSSRESAAGNAPGGVQDSPLSPIAKIEENNGCVVFVDSCENAAAEKVAESEMAENAANLGGESSGAPRLKISAEFAKAWHLRGAESMGESANPPNPSSPSNPPQTPTQPQSQPAKIYFEHSPNAPIEAICELDSRFLGVIAILSGAKAPKRGYYRVRIAQNAQPRERNLGGL